MNQPESCCPLCLKPVDDLIHALAHPDTEEPAHFECVLCSIRDAEHLEPGEQICYVGGGVFGILCVRHKRHSARIRKRIPYESESVVPDWRRDLVRTLPSANADLVAAN